MSLQDFKIQNGLNILDGLIEGQIKIYAGSPEGNVIATVGSLCLDTTGGDLYKKKTGTGNTGWVNIGSTDAFTYKEPVRVATVGSITLSGTQTIDGVAVVADDRVLVKDQSGASPTAGAANGIYVVAAGAWSRATDFDSTDEVVSGSIIPVSEGTVNSDSIWMMITDGTITVGTTPIGFQSIGIYTAGNGIDISGGVISVDVDDSSLTNTGGTGDQVAIKADGVNATHIDLGSGVNQVNAETIPLDVSGSYAGSATDVQGALEELEGSIPSYVGGSGVDITGSFVSADLDAAGGIGLNSDSLKLNVDTATNSTYISGANEVSVSGYARISGSGIDPNASTVLLDSVSAPSVKWIITLIDGASSIERYVSEIISLNDGGLTADHSEYGVLIIGNTFKGNEVSFSVITAGGNMMLNLDTASKTDVDYFITRIIQDVPA